MKAIYTLLFLLYIVRPGLSQPMDIRGGNIKGTIKTIDNQPAPFVNVRIKELNRGTTTDETGTYHFKNIKQGIYTITASFIGLQTQETSVAIKNEETVVVNFILTESAHQLNEIVIHDFSNLNEKPASIGKAFLKPMDIPQSIVVLDKTVLDRQQTLRLSDVLMNTNGVYVMGTTGGTQEEIAGRGFAFGSSNTFKNGVRFNNGIMPEVTSLEKVEILKGSNAILFGNVAAGGVLNLVTKKPKFENGGELAFRSATYDFYKPSFDVYGPINNSHSVAYRINTSYENAGSFRNEVKSERIYFNPSFLIRAGKKTEILLEGDYLKDNRTLDYGTGAINYEIIKIDRRRFLGASWSYNKALQKSSTLTLTHNFNNSWQLRAITSYQGFNNDAYGTTRPNNGNFVQPDGTWLRGLQRSGTDQNYYLAELDAIGKMNTGSIEHNLLIGSDIDKYENNTLAYSYKNPLANPKINNGNVYDSINVFDLNLYPQRKDIPEIPLLTITRNPIHRTGFYIQDLVSLSSKFKVLAGVRYSLIRSESKVITHSTGKESISSYKDDAFTPRLGLVYQPIKEISLFSSYANSFTLNTAVGTKGEALPPTFINQYEAGIKTDLFKGMLSANLTVYKIINSNLAQPVLSTSPDYNPDYPNAQELAGEVTSRGLEVDIMSKPIHGFSFIGGYSFNDTRYTKSQQYLSGSRLRYNPSHTANASVNYTFNSFVKGLNLGVIGFYMGDRVAGRSTRTAIANDSYKLMRIPDYFQFDLSAGYSFDKVSLRAKVSNVLNVLSYQVHDDNSVNPIAPRIFSATVAYKL